MEEYNLKAYILCFSFLREHPLKEKMKLTLNRSGNITEKDGMIYIMPVTVYPKKYLNELRNEIDEIVMIVDIGHHDILKKF